MLFWALVTWEYSNIFGAVATQTLRSINRHAKGIPIADIQVTQPKGNDAFSMHRAAIGWPLAPAIMIRAPRDQQTKGGSPAYSFTEDQPVVLRRNANTQSRLSTPLKGADDKFWIQTLRLTLRGTAKSSLNSELQ
ncbi:hypothetical protein LAZ67_1005671 [Cordylochernes scorpioides]|uniref:Uncharacterized protein n=1 Tax=Cordylochernes scorpioides TaxID=51811 RepID=A0ABY6K1W2_9ARAC|nr:hypothetical protein LAZ67_1005671 [Cordylochernes scorpioides]